jgi:hypothetical protein
MPMDQDFLDALRMPPGTVKRIRRVLEPIWETWECGDDDPDERPTQADVTRVLAIEFGCEPSRALLMRARYEGINYAFCVHTSYQGEGPSETPEFWWGPKYVDPDAAMLWDAALGSMGVDARAAGLGMNP